MDLSIVLGMLRLQGGLIVSQWILRTVIVGVDSVLQFLLRFSGSILSVPHPQSGLKFRQISSH